MSPHSCTWRAPKSDAPRLIPCRYATPALMGQRPYNEFRKRIEAGICDPRFRVVFGAIMWDSSKPLHSAT